MSSLRQLNKLKCDEVPPPVMRDGLQHYDSFHVDSCLCAYCQDYRSARASLTVIMDKMEETPCECAFCAQTMSGKVWAHSRGCQCELCRQAEKAHTVFMAAANRRDFWSEMSYHAVHDPDLLRGGWSNALMDWAAGELSADRSRGMTGFWSVIANRLTVGHWINRFETSVLAALPAVSG